MSTKALKNALQNITGTDMTACLHLRYRPSERFCHLRNGPYGLKFNHFIMKRPVFHPPEMGFGKGGGDLPLQKEYT